MAVVRRAGGAVWRWLCRVWLENHATTAMVYGLASVSFAGRALKPGLGWSEWVDYIGAVILGVWALREVKSYILHDLKLKLVTEEPGGGGNKKPAETLAPLREPSKQAAKFH